MNHPDDGPFYEIVNEAGTMADLGATCFQKFTCLACNTRQTMDTPNVFYKTGRCQECSFITNLEVEGCGFMLVASSDPEEHAKFVKALQESIAAAQPRNRN